MLNIKTVSVVGANGTMGATVAGLVAAFGGAKVFLICRKKEAAEGAVDVAANSVKADSIRSRLIPATYEEFEKCVSQSDWVFESVAESTAIKSEIYQRIDKCMKPDAIITTGTSGFSINTLSENFSEKAKSRFFGTHFFNPPYSLTLCEVIRSKKTDAKLFDEMKAYLKDTLFRDLIETTDTPAFLGNRIGFHFLNKALQYAVKYQKEGGIDYIDAILGPFTGRGMTPIATVDFVGLDVHKAIVDNIQANSKDYDNAAFVLPEFVAKLIAEGKLGMKTKDGLFKVIVNEDKSKQFLVYDIASGSLRPARKYALPFAKEMVSHLAAGNYDKAVAALKADKSKEGLLCKHFLVSYVTYGIVTAQAVSPQITDADIAMSTGFNWIGPVALMEALGGYDEVVKMAKEVDLDKNLVKQLQGVEAKNRKPASLPFDYRKFFRAKL
jgi:3-hydroxyacyl-CoA dehydrogenase